MNEISAEKSFDLLYTALSGYQARFFDSAFTVTASLLLVIGWITTAETARDYLRAHLWIRVAGSLCILFCSYLYGLFSLRLYRVSARTAALLQDLAYAPSPYFIGKQLRLDTVWMFISANAAISLVACGMILWAGTRTPPQN